MDYEPHIALFVNDDDPLIFYRVIIDFAKKNLNNNGKLYFEINEEMGGDVKKILKETGFQNVKVKKDMNGKNRIAVGCFKFLRKESYGQVSSFVFFV